MKGKYIASNQNAEMDFGEVVALRLVMARRASCPSDQAVPPGPEDFPAAERQQIGPVMGSLSLKALV